MQYEMHHIKHSFDRITIKTFFSTNLKDITLHVSLRSNSLLFNKTKLVQNISSFLTLSSDDGIIKEGIMR